MQSSGNPNHPPSHFRRVLGVPPPPSPRIWRTLCHAVECSGDESTSGCEGVIHRSPVERGKYIPFAQCRAPVLQSVHTPTATQAALYVIQHSRKIRAGMRGEVQSAFLYRLFIIWPSDH
ncbi:uncharacterized [Tachysurus ichikawai]